MFLHKSIIYLFSLEFLHCLKFVYEFCNNIFIDNVLIAFIKHAITIAGMLIFWRDMKKKIPVQLSLDPEVLEMINREVKRTFCTRSSWFTKLALNELKRVEEETPKLGNGKIKKVIDLDI